GARRGVSALLVGLCAVVWGPAAKPVAVRLFPSRAVRCGSRACHLPGTNLSVSIGVDQLAIVLVVACLSLALYLLFQRTALGVRIRAVVDSRQLAELTGIDADGVSALSWAMGCGLAGLTGVLLAPVTFG